MNKPCHECPFSTANTAKAATTAGLVVFMSRVCATEGQTCHLSDDHDCEGARRFWAGEPGAFCSLSELAAARDPGTYAVDLCRELERLTGERIPGKELVELMERVI